MDDEEQATELAVTAAMPAKERVPELSDLVLLPTHIDAKAELEMPGFVPWHYPKKKFGALQNPFNGTFVMTKSCQSCKTSVRHC